MDTPTRILPPIDAETRARATLSASDHDGARIIVLDCRHGTTTVAYINAPGGVPLDDVAATRIALTRHELTEGCRCTRDLRRRYGVGEVR